MATIDQSNLSGEWKDKTIPQPDAVAAQDVKYVKVFQQYNVSNPHPGFGTDPNILNEFGHTLYPKWITKPNGEKAIVNSPAEEAEQMGHNLPEKDKKELPNQLRQDGPTLTEYVAAGYDPKNYPPKGYTSKHSEEEIKDFIAKHHKISW